MNPLAALPLVLSLRSCQDPRLHFYLTPGVCVKAGDRSYYFNCMQEKPFYLVYPSSPDCKGKPFANRADACNTSGYKAACVRAQFNGTATMRISGCSGGDTPTHSAVEPCTPVVQDRSIFSTKFRSRRVRCDADGFYDVAYTDTECSSPTNVALDISALGGYTKCGYFQRNKRVDLTCG